MVRAAAILLPFSVLFVKYLPEFGRGFDPWTGVGYFSGVMLTKNDLGYVCMIFGVFFLWNILSRSTLHGSKVRRDEVLVSGLFLGLVAYLLGLANSATSVATLTIGAITLFGLGSKFVSRKNFGFYLIAVCACLLIIEATLGLYEEESGLWAAMLP